MKRRAYATNDSGSHNYAQDWDVFRRPMITTEARTSTTAKYERSLLSEMLPNTQHFSARAVRYNEYHPLVGSDASLSESIVSNNIWESRGGGGSPPSSYEYKTSPMLDWFSASTSNPCVSFVANENGNRNSLSALAGSFQVSQPLSRTYNDGSAIGDFSPTSGTGGSNAMGGGEMGTGRTFNYGRGDQGLASDYYSRPTATESIRDAGVKV